MSRSSSVQIAGTVDRRGGEPSRPARRAQQHLGRAILAIAGVSLGVACGGYALGLRANLTTSIPTGLYQLERGPIRHGTIVLVCLPAPISAFAHARGFIPRGSCSDGNAPIGKTVAAVQGDTVDVSPIGIAVNGRALLRSHALTFDSSNRPLHPFPSGRHFVRNGTVWLVSSTSSRSFDSRYFGPVDINSVVARIRPLLTFY